MVAAQRVGVQRRAFKIGMTLSTKSRSKIAPISGREARPLERRVGRARSMLDGIRIDTTRQHCGTKSRLGLLARRCGCKAGECSQRCLHPLRCAQGTLTASVQGTSERSAPARTLRSTAAVLRGAARYASAPWKREQAVSECQRLLVAPDRIRDIGRCE